MEHIHCRLEYTAKDDPKVRISVNDSVVHEFIGGNTHEEFEFVARDKNLIFKIEHYDKDMKKEINKYIEIKKIYFNDVDIKDMIWETTQQADIPSWQNKSDFVWQSNLYLGHNASISYNLESPIMEFLLDYHQPDKKTTVGMSSDNNNLLHEMKEYFQQIVDQQKNINR